MQSSKTELALKESSSVATVNISSMHRTKDTKGIPYPAHLPQLTPRLKKILETIGVFNGIKDFIYFWASYLLDVTGNQPTKQDYQNLAMTIVETYPCLKGGNNGCVSFLFTCYSIRFENVFKRLLISIFINESKVFFLKFYF